MEISIVQAILIALWTGLCLAGMLLGIYTNRCLVMATGVGIILGNPMAGLAMGAVGELAFMGYGVSQGGSIPPNHMGPGIVGAIMVITAGIDVEQALALSIPFAVGFQFVLTATYTFATTLTPLATKALEQKNFKKFSIFANTTVWVFFIVGTLIGLMAALAAPAAGTVYTVAHDYDCDYKTYLGKKTVTKVYCAECDAEFAFVAGKVSDAIAKFGAGNYLPTTLADAAGTVYVSIAPVGGTVVTPSTDKVQSAETFDAGIAMYVGMSVMAAAGSVVVLKKRED